MEISRRGLSNAPLPQHTRVFEDQLGKNNHLAVLHGVRRRGLPTTRCVTLGQSKRRGGCVGGGMDVLVSRIYSG